MRPATASHAGPVFVSCCMALISRSSETVQVRKARNKRYSKKKLGCFKPDPGQTSWAPPVSPILTPSYILSPSSCCTIRIHPARLAPLCYLETSPCFCTVLERPQLDASLKLQLKNSRRKLPMVLSAPSPHRSRSLYDTCHRSSFSSSRSPTFHRSIHRISFDQTGEVFISPFVHLPVW